MNLGFFFSRNMSVNLWDKLGLLDREKLIYEKHLEKGYLENIYWFTYGVDDEVLNIHPKIHIISMPKIFDSKIGRILYTILLPYIQGKYIKKCDVLKTDQMDGSWTAVISKLLYNKKLLVRTGFTLSMFMKEKGSILKKLISIIVEKFAYRFADFSTVSSQDSLDYIKNKYQILNDKCMKLNNYVDINQFKKINQNTENKFIFIGRLEEQKNIFNLLDAVEKLSLQLDIYGEGTLKNQLVEIINKKNLKVNFMGKVRNSEIPNILSEYRYYILPSFFEGMPKTLLEAMSCGLYCIGSNTSGIKEIIKDGYNGYLIDGFDSNEIVKKIKYMIENANVKISDNARKTIEEDYSLDVYAERENFIFMKMINE